MNQLLELFNQLKANNHELSISITWDKYNGWDVTIQSNYEGIIVHEDGADLDFVCGCAYIDLYRWRHD